MSFRQYSISMLICIIFLICEFQISFALMNHTGTWNGKRYPDLRGPTRILCGHHMPLRNYLCDPDRLIGKEDAKRLNIRLHALANSTKCKCQRHGQCIGQDLDGNEVKVGFIVSVAFAKRLEISDSDPALARRIHVADQFAKALRGRWALGDCGNSAIIVIWEDYKLLYILPDRVTKLYLTPMEASRISELVNGYVEERDYMRALDIVLKEIEKELLGFAEKRIDIGKLSLIVSVTVAIVFVTIITGCVCAFRCCGNLRPDTEAPMGQKQEQSDSLKSQVNRGGSLLGRSLSRSPKLPHHHPSPRLDHSVPLIQSQGARSATGTPSPNIAANRQLLASMAAQQLPRRTNMARLASPYYSVEDGHSMV